MHSANDQEGGYGRPPADYEFRPERKGSRSGRPAGSRNTKTIVQAIAREKHRIKHHGKVVELTTVELLFHALTLKAMRGDLPANRALEKLQDRICPSDDNASCIVVPEELPDDMWIKLAELRNARKKHPNER